jgi:hypothetical protein
MLDDIFILLIFFIGFGGILVLGGLFELVLNFFSEEAVPEPDVWIDAAESLRYWSETLEIFSEQFDAIAKKAYATLEIEYQNLLPR